MARIVKILPHLSIVVKYLGVAAQYKWELQHNI